MHNSKPRLPVQTPATKHTQRKINRYQTEVGTGITVEEVEDIINNKA